MTDFGLLFTTMFGVFVTAFLPLVMYLAVFLGTTERSRIFRRIGMDIKTMNLLTFCAFIATILGFLGIVIPLLIFQNTYMGLNIAGAFIPLLLTYYFIRNTIFKNKLVSHLWFGFVIVITMILTTVFYYNTYISSNNYTIQMSAALLAVSVLAGLSGIVIYKLTKEIENSILFSYSLIMFIVISFVTSMVVRVQLTGEAQGIVSEFPYYLIPIAIVGLATIPVFYKDFPRGAVFGYSIATLGSIAGADVYHLPELYLMFSYLSSKNSHLSFVGAIGGAGMMDMVFLYGLFAFFLIIIFSRDIYKYPAEQDSESSSKERELSELINASRSINYREKNLPLLNKIKFYLDEQIKSFGQKINITKYGMQSVINGSEPEKIILQLPIPEYVKRDYYTFMNVVNDKDATPYEIYKSIVTGLNIYTLLEKNERNIYGKFFNRGHAFLIDMLVSFIITLTLIIGYLFFVPISAVALDVLITLVISSSATIPFIYYVVQESLFGKSIGKRLLKLRVYTVNFERPDIISITARHVTTLVFTTVIGIFMGMVMIVALRFQISSIVTKGVFVALFLGIMLGIVLVFTLVMVLIVYATVEYSARHQRIGDMLGRTVVVQES